MEQVALYRKYRPHNFDNLVGQDHVKTTFANAIKANRISHAYLFSGPRGTGKTSTARLIAKAINCVDLQDEFEPCDKCEFCKDINDGRLIDLIEIDAASNRGIDEVRDLKEKINFAPSRAKSKIYIIDEVHMMTKEAFNALLKTLEEPPSHAFFILATTEIHKIPETIISRCQRFDFKRINKKALMTRLSYIAQKEEITAEDKALEAISQYVDGGMRDAIGLLEQLTVDKKLTFEYVQDILGISDHSLLIALFDALSKNDHKEGLRIVQDLHSQGSDLKQFLHEFLGMLREKMLKSVSDNKPEMTGRLLRMIDIFKDAQPRLQTMGIPQLPLEIAVLEVTGGFKNVVVAQSAAKVADVNEAPSKASDNTPAPVAPVVKADKVPETKTVEVEKSSAKVAAATENRDHKSVSENQEKIPLSLESLKEKWPRITERIKTPALRISLRNALPIEIKDADIKLQFDTTFHKDKVMEPDNRVELERMIGEFFSTSVKISSIVKKLEIKPVVEEKKVTAEVPQQPEQKAQDGGTVDAALEIFGGEVVE